jgi:hypothetical protein
MSMSYGCSCSARASTLPFRTVYCVASTIRKPTTVPGQQYELQERACCALISLPSWRDPDWGFQNVGQPSLS